MRIQYCSDLHLEFPHNKSWLAEYPLMPTAETLIIAGDTHYLGPEYAKLDFFKWASDNYKRTFVISGNHEYYGGYDLSLHQKPFKWEIQRNVFLLNNHVEIIEDISFLFSTFWSHIYPENEKFVSSGVNDFYKIMINQRRLTVDDFNMLHNEAYTFIRENLKPLNDKTVVVTHHLPTPLCNSPEFEGSPINNAFVVDTTDFITKSDIDYWIYGHIHRNIGNGTMLGDTTMVCNQLGYVHMNEHYNFSRDSFIEIA